MVMSAQSKAAKRPKAKQRAYAKPPILEAMVEFRFSEPLPSRVVERVSKRLGKGYDTVNAEKEVTFGFDVLKGAAEITSESPRFRHASDDQVDIFVARSGSLIWSRLAPYEGWESFSLRLRREATTAFSLTGPKKLARIGMRYINRIDVPTDPDSGLCRYEDYIAINLELPSLMDPLSAYSWHIERTFSDSGLKAMMRSATLIPEIPGTVAFLLDIDVAMVMDIPLKIEEVLDNLEPMRALKNSLFECAITDRARKAFN